MEHRVYSNRDIARAYNRRSSIVVLAIFLIFFSIACSKSNDPIADPVQVVKSAYVDALKSITVGDVLERRPGCSTNIWQTMKADDGHQLVTLTCEVLISPEYLDRARQYLVEQETRMIRNRVFDHRTQVSAAQNDLSRLTSSTTEGPVHINTGTSVLPDETDAHHFMVSFIDETSGPEQLSDTQLVDAVEPARGVQAFMQLFRAAGWDPMGLLAQVRFMNELEGQAREDYKRRNVNPQLAILRSRLDEVRGSFESNIQANELASQRRRDGAARALAVHERRAAVEARDLALRIQRAEGALEERQRELEAVTNSLDSATAEALKKALRKVPREQIVERWEWLISSDETVIPLRYYLAAIDQEESEQIISEIRGMASKDIGSSEIQRHYSRVNFRSRAGDTGLMILMHYSSFTFLVHVS